jgi:hypothetical protein
LMGVTIGDGDLLVGGGVHVRRRPQCARTRLLSASSSDPAIKLAAAAPR